MQLTHSLRFVTFAFSLAWLSGCAAGSGTSPSRVDAGSMDSAAGDAGYCLDSDSDFICDTDEGTNDSDGDGTLDWQDTDSDNDSIPDGLEAGDFDLSTPPVDSNDDGIPDYADPDYPHARDGGTTPILDIGTVDGSGVYMTDAGDGGTVVEELCPPEAMVPTACLAEVSEGAALLCDGLDNDCDGAVDESCYCTPGAVQPCFRGPPGLRGVGACQDGTQRCIAADEFGTWGDCEGGIAPVAEACDDLDNDCNGCTDEIIGCVPTGSCPGPDDPRVPVGTPFSTYALNGAEFYPGSDAATWHWSVTGTPCDEMFLAIPGSTATSENGQLSFTLMNANSRDAGLRVNLSGDYTVTLTVTHGDGSTFTCTWIVHIRAPGLRVELCWDITGPTTSAANAVDLDLHLGKTGTTTEWFASNSCFFGNCRRTDPGPTSPGWGYPASAAGSCGHAGACPNPRLDIDNIAETTSYVPENINVDNPRDHDRFRVAVNHYSTDRTVHPLVSVYCGGRLAATYGAAPDLVTTLYDGVVATPFGILDFGDTWHVANVEMSVDTAGVTTDCTVTPITPPSGGHGYHVVQDDPTY